MITRIGDKRNIGVDQRGVGQVGALKCDRKKCLMLTAIEIGILFAVTETRQEHRAAKRETGI